MWVGGIGDCGCGLVGCVDSSVISVWIGGFFFLLVFLLLLLLLLDGSVDLVAQWEAGVSILREMVVDDGGCVGCVGSVREVTVLNK